MEGIIVPFIVFASITAWILGPRYIRYLHERDLKQVAGPDPATRGLVQENSELRARVENLESIVCSVDYEINTRINNLLRESNAPALPAPQPEAAMVARPFSTAEPAAPVANEVASAPLNKQVPSLRALRSDVPEAIDAALRRALAKSPSDRFASASELAHAWGAAA